MSKSVFKSIPQFIKKTVQKSAETNEAEFNLKYDRVHTGLNGLTNAELCRKKRYWNERRATFKSLERMALYAGLVSLLLMCLLDIAAYKSGIEVGFINVSAPYMVVLFFVVFCFSELTKGIQFRLNVLEDIIVLRNQDTK